MKVTFSLVIVSSLMLLGLLVAPNVVSAQEETASPCQLADDYLASGLLKFAQTAYEKVLETSPVEKCAVKGLAAIGQKKCDVAKKQVEVGEIESARATYLEIITEQPDLGCAIEGLSTLGPATCADAELYLREGTVSLAEGVYNKIIEIHPQESCALMGLVSVAEKKCELAENQASSGDVDGAKITYNAILAGYPNLGCAVNGLADLSNPAAVIEGLILIGNYDQAWTNLDAALQKDPGNDKLLALAKQPWALTYKANKFWTTFASSIFYLIGALVALYLLIRFIGLMIQRRNVKLHVQQFNMGLVAALPSVGDQLENLEKRVTIRFEESLIKLGRVRRVRRPDVIDQPMTPLTLPDLSNALPLNVGGLLTQLINAIGTMFPPKQVSVLCRLDEDAEKGLGIGVKLVYSRNNEVWGADYIWEKDLEPGSLSYQLDKTDPIDSEIVVKALALVKYAAIISIWRFFEGKYESKAETYLLDAFGTSIYRSHIATHLATEAQMKKPKELDVVEKLLRQALTLDPNNVVALNNLGNLMYQKSNIELEKNEKARYQAYQIEGMEYLHKALRVCEEKELSAPTVQITANYILGIMELEREGGNKIDAKDHLLVAAQKAIDGGPETIDLLDMVNIPYASILRKSDPPAAEAMIKEITDKAHTNPRVIYNLACYFSAASSNDPNVYFNKSLDYLKRTFIADASYVEYSKTDPSLKGLRTSRRADYKRVLGEFAKQA
jgi:tetratricopeptide (TPR) repeat protein